MLLKLLTMMVAAVAVGHLVYAVHHSEMLGEEYVSRGTVKKFTWPKVFWSAVVRKLLLNDVPCVEQVTAIAFLAFGRKAEIRDHEHEKDNERYYLFTWCGLKLVSDCRAGNSHGYTTGKRRALILAVKWE